MLAGHRWLPPLSPGQGAAPGTLEIAPLRWRRGRRDDCPASMAPLAACGAGCPELPLRARDRICDARAAWDAGVAGTWTRVDSNHRPRPLTATKSIPDRALTGGAQEQSAPFQLHLCLDGPSRSTYGPRGTRTLRRLGAHQAFPGSATNGGPGPSCCGQLGNRSLYGTGQTSDPTPSVGGAAL